MLAAKAVGLALQDYYVARLQSQQSVVSGANTQQGAFLTNIDKRSEC